jgi:hypothetical protein
MAMPKTAMYEDCFTQLAEHEVGRARQVSRMKPVSVAERVYELANSEFRLGIFPLHPRHPLASFCWAKRVDHI